MFYKYAVDPKCFAEWDSFRSFIGNLGWKQGRLISRFPRRWRKLVDENIEKNKKEGKIMTFKQNQKIIQVLKDLDKFLINSGCDFRNETGWLENAIHCSSEFHAIIAEDNLSGHANVLVARELTLDDDLWKNEFTDIVPSTPEGLCRCAELLLKESDNIIFIDPYFFKRDNEKDKERWLVTLKKFIEVAKNENTVFEYHLEISDNEYLKKPDKRKEDFQIDCDNSIKNILPFGIKITLYRWKKIDHTGDKFHARYILTNLGGVWFDVGLDKGKLGETTNVARLEEKVWKTRLDSFKEEKVYDFVDKVEVVGE